MTSSDVRSILGLPLVSSSSSSVAPKRVQSLNKRPDGISRELYALIGNNAPSLAEAQASVAAVKYRAKPALNRKKVKWSASKPSYADGKLIFSDREKLSFTPEARKDGSLKLRHWVRTTDVEPDASVEYFGKFNLHGPSVMEYSQFEYDQHLADPDWTAHETQYLFDLLRTYDLRFVVTADRYEYMGLTGEGPVKTRSIEDIKDRYYTVCRRLTRTRTAADPQTQSQLIQSYSFDKGREIKRKQYAGELFHLTAAEIAEEEALYVEIKRMEQTQRRYSSDRDDLLRTVVGLDSGLVNIDSANVELILGVDKNKKRKRADEVDALATPISAPPTKKQKESAAFDAAHCITRTPASAQTPTSSHLAARHPIHTPAFLRSTKLPTPRPNAAIRITDLLAEMGINVHALVMPTQSNINEFDGLLLASGALIDIKRQCDRVEQDLRTLRAQREGYVPPVDGKRKDRSLSMDSDDSA